MLRVDRQSLTPAALLVGALLTVAAGPVVGTALAYANRLIYAHKKRGHA